MSDSAQLLRMLEPAVRPVAPQPGPRTDPVGVAPFESRRFDELLAEAAALDRGEGSGPAEPGGLDEAGDAGRADQAEPAAAGRRRVGLGGLDRIENASLRRLLAGASGPGPAGAGPPATP